MPSAPSSKESLALVRQGGEAYMAYADARLVRSVGALVYVVVGVASGLALPVTPPDATGEGWLVAGLVIAGHLVFALWLATRWSERSWDPLLAGSLACLGGLCLLQALGGPAAPFRTLIFLELMFIAAVHTPRRTVLALALTVLGSAAALLVHTHQAARLVDVAMYALVWTLFTAIVVLWTAGVRVGRERLEAATAEAARLARVDQLSGLGNRRAFDETLRREMARARRSRRPLSLLIADMNDFKRINDEYGHATGDRVLRGVAEVLRTALRSADLCFRWGGDEFTVVLPETAVGEADMVGHRLQDAIHVICRDPDGVRLSMTVGAAELREGMGADDLLDAADIALLAAKARPRPRAVRLPA